MTTESFKQKNADDIICFEKNLDKLEDDWDGKVSFYPRYLQIEHTTRCNARCIMCNHLYTGNRGAMDLDLDILYRMQDVLKYAEIVMLNGDGEPFLYADIEKSLALLQKYEVMIGTNTNLTYIPDKVWGYLRDSFSFLNISCDGSSKTLYETIRKGLSFEKFVDNLEKLNRVAPDLNKNLDCVLMRQNIGDMKNLVKFAAEHGFKSVKFHALGVNPVIGNMDDAPELYSHYLAEQAGKAKAAAVSLGIDMQCPSVSISEEGSIEDDLRRIEEEELRSADRIKKAEEKAVDLTFQYQRIQVTDEDISPAPYDNGDVCRWAIERCYVDLMGNVTTCCYDMRHAYGNLHEKSFDGIWNGPSYRHFRKEIIHGRLPEWCRQCQWIKQAVF
jgi:radical SAM protein with 4Fe4S-binding SPASM domain